jgi:hypothetical protein
MEIKGTAADFSAPRPANRPTNGRFCARPSDSWLRVGKPDGDEPTAQTCRPCPADQRLTVASLCDRDCSRIEVPAEGGEIVFVAGFCRAGTRREAVIAGVEVGAGGAHDDDVCGSYRSHGVGIGH